MPALLSATGLEGMLGGRMLLSVAWRTQLVQVLRGAGSLSSSQERAVKPGFVDDAPVCSVNW